MHIIAARSFTAAVARAVACVSFVAASTQCPVLFAQNLAGSPAGVALGQAILKSSRNAIDSQIAAALAAKSGTSAQEAAAAPGSAAPSLTYEPDPALSDWTRVTMIDTLANGDPQLRRRMQEAFADNSVLQDFDSFMSARGYSSHNVADDTAELLLVSWQIVTDSTPTISQSRGVHEQTHSIFIGNPQLRAMTDADRQLMAERIAYQVVISSSARTQYIRNGNPSQHKQLQE